MSVTDNNPGRHIGEYLLERGSISLDQLNSALALERETGERLGEILVDRGYISRLDLASAIGAQWARQDPPQQPEHPAANEPVTWEPPVLTPAAPVTAEPVETAFVPTDWAAVEAAAALAPPEAPAEQVDLWPAPSAAPAPVEEPTPVAYPAPEVELVTLTAEPPVPAPPPANLPPAAEFVSQEAPVRPAIESDERLLGDLQLRLRSVCEHLAASDARLATLESLVAELTYANTALRTQVETHGQELDALRNVTARQQAQLTTAAHALLS